jgi:hypothetical protein
MSSIKKNIYRKCEVTVDKFYTSSNTVREIKDKIKLECERNAYEI